MLEHTVQLPKKFEIILSEANNKPVSLSSMSTEALESFLITMNSLKSIASKLIPEDELIFSISEGSASGAVEARDDLLDNVYSAVDLAIVGKSDDKFITKHLRAIQKELKQDNYNYKFRYENEDGVVKLHPKLIESKRIGVRRQRLPFEYKLRVVSGLLNQIGGVNPNYHFNEGLDESITIDCSMDQAIRVNKFLYQSIEALLFCKEWNVKGKKNEYTHKVILDTGMAPVFKRFLNSYYKEGDLIERLNLMYSFVDLVLSKENGLKYLNYLLLAFNDKNFHLSELKTLLVISKPLKEHELIKESRLAILETYNTKRG